MTPAGRHLLKQGNIPFRGGEKGGKLAKQVPVLADMLLAGYRMAEQPPAEPALGDTRLLAPGSRGKVPSVEQVPAENPEVQ